MEIKYLLTSFLPLPGKPELGKFGLGPQKFPNCLAWKKEPEGGEEGNPKLTKERI